MMRSTLLLLFGCLASMVQAQRYLSITDHRCGEPEAAVQVHPLHRDTTCSSSLLCITGHVPAHFHARHTEHVSVLSGKGHLRLGHDTVALGAGSLVVIPPGTVHAAWCAAGDTLRVMSVFAPPFDGVDRIPAQPSDR